MREGAGHHQRKGRCPGNAEPIALAPARGRPEQSHRDARHQQASQQKFAEVVRGLPSRSMSSSAAWTTMVHASRPWRSQTRHQAPSTQLHHSPQRQRQTLAQAGHAHHRAGVKARRAQHFGQQVGGAVSTSACAPKVRRRVQKPCSSANFATRSSEPACALTAASSSTAPSAPWRSPLCGRVLGPEATLSTSPGCARGARAETKSRPFASTQVA